MAVRFPLVLDYLFAKYFGSVSVDDCAQTEILVCRFGADSGPGMVLSSVMVPGCAQASNAQTSILVCAHSPIKMPSEVADFPLILSKYAS